MEPFNYFNEIENPLLRTWNRLIMVYNLRQDAGTHVAQEYINNLSAEENKQLIYMGVLIQRKGKDEVKAMVMDSIKLEEEAVG